ncbi:DNA damage-regulated autophagy modulator protein 1-like isoform X1 [Lineus longissimus]|uniref:DNA damage-regulated autophagy modulator protein 1-like isoform X1 n=1 Tax=Lineus longissimus TaxID=88925 RepID=UPI002B4ED98D
MCGWYPNLSWIPMFLGCLTVVTFFVSYAIAIYEGDVAAYFPYISDTGANTPESCIFGEFLNIAAFLAFITIFIRFKLVSSFTRDTIRSVKILNVIGMVIGAISSFGLTMVANFQDNKIEVVHIIGASFVFGLGVAYTWVQVAISFLMYPDYNALTICVVRAVMSCISTISMVMAFVTAMIARTAWTNSGPHDHPRQKWQPTDPGFDEHIVSTFSEWVMAIAFVLYFFTFIRDFQKIKLKVTVDPLVQHLGEAPPPRNVAPAANETSGLLAHA